VDKKNYEIVQGDSFILQVTYANSSGSPINLTGYSAVFAVSDQPGGIVSASASISSISASGGSGDGITVNSASSGMFNINLTPAKTRVFNLPKSSYQFQITSPQGVNTTLNQGWFIVDAGVI
jgi:hypothetical protein